MIPRYERQLLPVGVLVSGRGTNLQAILDSSKAGLIPAEVRVVISNHKGAMALRRAKEARVPSFVVTSREFGQWPSCRRPYERKIVEILKNFGVELVVLAGYDRLVGEEMLNAFPGRIINIHPSLLPAFPGLHAQRQALEYGVKIAGCSVFFVDDSVDGGPIILQAAVSVLDDDDEETLSARILREEHRILCEAVRLFAEGRLEIQGRRVRILP